MKTNETKVHYKMYKIGKKWAVAAIAVGTFSLASGYTLTSAHADDTAVTTEQTLPVSSAADVVEPATELTSSAVSAVDSSAVAEVEAPTAIETPQSTAPITTSSAAPTTSVSTSAAPKAAAANVIQKNNKNYTQVTRENFVDYFNLNGSAEYDSDSGIITITENKNNQVGNFALKEKIDMNEDFTLTGKVNIGDTSQVINKTIADGIGFAFHEGNTTDVGKDGGNLGIGGLPGAIGFKLDTYYNQRQEPKNPATGDKDWYGWAADPTRQLPYGAFANTNSTPELINGQYVYWAYSDSDSVQRLNPNILDGSFHDFTIQYTDHVLTITLTTAENDSKTYVWTEHVDSGQSAMAMIISASTGWGATVQEFQFDSFEYTAASTVNVRYVDADYNDIQLSPDLLADSKPIYSDGESVGSQYKTNKLEIPGYKFVGMGTDSISANGVLTEIGDNGTVIYVYHLANYETEFNTVTQTINYVDALDHSKEMAPSNLQTIGFVTVTDDDGQMKTYYKIDATMEPEIDADGLPPADWTVISDDHQAGYETIGHPDVDNYRVVSTSETTPNLSEIVGTPVTTNDANSIINVYYGVDYRMEVETVKRVIEYVNESNDPVADAKTQTVSFVTVYDPTNPDDQGIMYHAFDTTTLPTLDVYGVPVDASWLVTGNVVNLARVPHPTVDKYRVIEVSDSTLGNLQTAYLHGVNSSSPDTRLVVIYGTDYKISRSSSTVQIIYYTDAARKWLADPAQKIINFIEIYNPIKESYSHFYTDTDHLFPLIDNNGEPIGNGDWHPGTSLQLEAIPHPKVNNYQVVWGTNPDLTDLEQTFPYKAEFLGQESVLAWVIYAPTYGISDYKTVTQTIKYVNENGAEIGFEANQQTVSFVTVNNPINDEKVTYYQIGTHAEPSLDEDGIPGDGWTLMDELSIYAPVPHPIDSRYTITKTSDEQNSDLTEVYARNVAITDDDHEILITYSSAYAISDYQIVNQTIKYVDQSGTEIGFDANKQAITFITVTNVKDPENPLTYYQIGNLEKPTLDESGIPVGAWTLMDDNSTFATVPHPTDSRYKIIRTSDTENSNLEEVFARNISIADSDHEIVITYAPDYQIGEQTRHNRQVNYVKQDSTPIEVPLKDSVSFVSVYNPVTDNSIGYYNTGDDAPIVLDDYGRPTGEWIEGTTYELIEVAHPIVDNYRVISTDNPIMTNLERAFSYIASFNPNNNHGGSSSILATIVYAPAYNVTEHKVVNQTIKYVDQNGAEIGFDDDLQSVSFVTVHNPDSNEDITYYQIGTVESPTLNDDGTPVGSWSLLDDDAKFNAVTHPEDSRYSIKYTSDDVNSDLTQVFDRNVSFADDDHTIVITYVPNYHVSDNIGVGRIITYYLQNPTSLDIYDETSVVGTFINVYNPVTEQTVQYQQTGIHLTPNINDDGTPEGDWINSNTFAFDAVPHPEVTNYIIYYSTIGDLMSAPAQTVTSDFGYQHNGVFYKPAYTISDFNTVNQTIQYRNQAGESVGEPDNQQSISFITIHNPVDNTDHTYLSGSTHEQPEIDELGVPMGDWTLMDETNFDAIDHPNITNYVVTSVDSSNADLTGVFANPVNTDSEDSLITVVYGPNYQAELHNVEQVIRYLDHTGESMANHDPYASDYYQTVSFLTVFNPVTGESNYFHRLDAADSAEIDEFGQPNSEWQVGDRVQVDAVAHHQVDKLRVNTVDFPDDADLGQARILTTVPAQTYTTTCNSRTFVIHYGPDYSAFTNQINQTIKYVDTKGNAMSTHNVATKDLSRTITFLVVNNPLEETQTVYYQMGQHADPTIDNDGNPGKEWINATSATFTAIANPTIDGFKVISTTDPSNDLTQITDQLINPNSVDQTLVVTYEAQTPVDPETPVDRETPTTPGGGSQTGTLSDQNVTKLPTNVDSKPLEVTTSSSKTLPKTAEAETQSQLRLFGAIMLGLSSLLSLITLGKFGPIRKKK